jgi:hypothetical protein
MVKNLQFVVVVCSIVLAHASCLMAICATPRIHCSARREPAGREGDSTDSWDGERRRSGWGIASEDAGLMM